MDPTLDKLRKDAISKILNKANEVGVTSGKWMLHPRRSDVDRIWLSGAKATIAGMPGPR
jgi:Domain of unknown function (DUF1917)